MKPKNWMLPSSTSTSPPIVNKKYKKEHNGIVNKSVLQVELKGGGAAATSTTSNILNNNNNNNNDLNKIKIKSKEAQTKSLLWMTIAMSLHFCGYELIRNTSMSLFTSPSVQLPKIAHPLSMSILSPFSTILLIWYSRIIRDNGPRIALRYTSILSFGVWISFGCILLYIRDSTANSSQLLQLKQTIVVLSFLFQHSYVYLLSTQYWSFIGSVVRQQQEQDNDNSNNKSSNNKNSSPVYFSTIAGVSSITSTIAASGVPTLLKLYPLESLLCIAGCIIILSLLCSEYAFSLAETYKFNPIRIDKQQQKTTTKENTKTSIQAALQLFKRVPILGALFYEEVIFQCLVTVSNVCFVTKLQVSIFNDNDRATWTGRYFGFINGCSGIFQFLIIPFLLKRVNVVHIRRMLPIFAIISTSILSIHDYAKISSSLLVASIPFFLVKLIDYSFRGVLNEMVYLPLDFESRYLGKEIVGVLASRFGKSGMSLLLSLFSLLFGNIFSDVRALSFLTNFMCALWLVAVFQLSRFINTDSSISTSIGIKKVKSN